MLIAILRDPQSCNGGFPCFHDSEVVSLILNRPGASQLSIPVAGFKQYTAAEKETPRLAGHHLCLGPPHATLITFSLEDIHDLELYQISHQNVLAGLSLDRADSRFQVKR